MWPEASSTDEMCEKGTVSIDVMSTYSQLHGKLMRSYRQYSKPFKFKISTYHGEKAHRDNYHGIIYKKETNKRGNIKRGGLKTVGKRMKSNRQIRTNNVANSSLDLRQELQASSRVTEKYMKATF